VSLADPKSLINAILPAGFTGPEIGAAIKNLVTTGSLTGAAGTVTIQDLVNQGEGLATVFNDASAGPAGLGAGNLLDVAGGLTAILGLVQGANTSDPLSIVSSVASLYSAVAGLANSAFGEMLPTVSGLFTQGIGAIASIVAGGGEAGATASAAAIAAVNAAAPYLAVAGPLVAGAILYALEKDTVKDQRSWAVIGPLATAMQTAAAQSLGQASTLFAAIEAQHVTDPTILRQAIQLGSSALLAYHRKAQGPAGPIGVSDFYARTGQNPAPLQNQAAAVQAGIVKAIAVLQAGGATAASLGTLAPAEWGDASLAGSRRANFFTPEQANAAANQTLGLIGGPVGLVPETVTAEGSPVWTGNLIPTGGVQGGIAALGAFAPDRATLAGEAQLFPVDTTNMEFGGPLWSMLAYLLGPTGQPESGGGGYYAALASQGVVAPTFAPGTIPDWLAQMIAAAAAARQAAFYAGGGDAGPTGTGPAGQGAGTAGSAAASAGPGPW
jgi:hypothetical protein